MIRRIVVGLFLVYLSLWLGAACLIEREITKLTDQGFEFQKIAVSGFPRAWRLYITSPKLTLQSPDEIQVFSSKAIGVILSLSLKTMRFELDNPLLLESQSGEKSKSFQIDLDPSTRLILKFAKPILLSTGGLLASLSGIRLDSENIYVSSGDEELAFLESTDIYLRRVKLDDSNVLDVALEINYAGSNEIFGFNSMRLSCEGDTEYNIDPDSKKIVLKSVDLENLELEINENTYLGLFGAVSLSQDDIPEGRFDLELQNHSELIDLLWSPNFDLTAKEAKDIINEVVDGQEAQELSLPVIFSDSGLTINGKNLRDLKGGE